jgi:hypothetical protein
MSYEKEEGIEGYFDTWQEAMNYGTELRKEEARNRKGACKQPCIYSEDCPCDWNLNICLTKF